MNGKLSEDDNACISKVVYLLIYNDCRIFEKEVIDIETHIKVNLLNFCCRAGMRQKTNMKLCFRLDKAAPKPVPAFFEWFSCFWDLGVCTECKTQAKGAEY